MRRAMERSELQLLVDRIADGGKPTGVVGVGAGATSEGCLASKNAAKVSSSLKFSVSAAVA